MCEGGATTAGRISLVSDLPVAACPVAVGVHDLPAEDRARRLLAQEARVQDRPCVTREVSLITPGGHGLMSCRDR